jgi:hypothetical protein
VAQNSAELQAEFVGRLGIVHAVIVSSECKA